MAIRLAAAALILIMVGPATILISLAALISSDLSANCGSPSGGDVIGRETPSSRVVFPLPKGVWVMTDGFGRRIHPVTADESFHTGLDLGAPAGTSIRAAADGIVAVAGLSDVYGGLIVIEHRVGDRAVATAYAHMWEAGIHVRIGDTVTAGQPIGEVGNAGRSTGPHLHFEVRPGGANGQPIDPVPWLNDHEATDLQQPESNMSPGCTGNRSSGPPEQMTGDRRQMVDDPTSDGRITEPMLHLYQQAIHAFPDTSWSCYSPRPGSKSEHPLGRACDITFGNPIGLNPTPDQLEDGWMITNWMKDHAEALGVEYLIWQGRIWSVARQTEGWRVYNGGGMHDPKDVTGGHYDHLHVTVAP
ncbi:M23 family metallopeptidase [Microlunatus speluncae]|uniref:M23 family metallopeptidase n=1 Tax=Microlunatus speluncae TaxID=2594267 RepID=UPI0012660F98|nr:M23 family metallopeptidase [Microlunatus speluncae]